MRPTLVALLTAAAALPFLASCSATVAPDGYGYNDATPAYYGPTYYSAPAPYPRYYESHPYYYHRAYDQRAYNRHVVRHDDHDTDRHDVDVHGRIAIEH